MRAKPLSREGLASNDQDVGPALEFLVRIAEGVAAVPKGANHANLAVAAASPAVH